MNFIKITKNILLRLHIGFSIFSGLLYVLYEYFWGTGILGWSSLFGVFAKGFVMGFIVNIYWLLYYEYELDLHGIKDYDRESIESHLNQSLIVHKSTDEIIRLIENDNKLATQIESYHDLQVQLKPLNNWLGKRIDTKITLNPIHKYETRLDFHSVYNKFPGMSGVLLILRRIYRLKIALHLKQEQSDHPYFE